MARVLIVIPARYHSTRLPGKPLVKIRGVAMVERVARVAAAACRDVTGCTYVVATDHAAIERFCREREIPVVMTPGDCRDGTERCLHATVEVERVTGETPRLVVNLQGDNPLCPPPVVRDLVRAWEEDPGAAVYTPCTRLDWEAYDALAEAKKTTPYSGTTVLVDKFMNALAFSKGMLPVIRRPGEARRLSAFSPARRHVGVYAYSRETLARYATLDPSPLERPEIEGLEQTRFLYNGLKVRVVEVDLQGLEAITGVDSAEDVARVEEILARRGEPDAGP
ncbi:MAG: 3-deoxy-manno-octulosonate cytidylyltransferase [Odoribacteraceae bacterium]|jgi:3-deoxy-manno-octulosonate cytidylyltransferase (CMP-KDO synthetase)|nr:3-deoxy-manno-octulosonate cytidylyltransferase [Odoribacteraceae bacterium]